MSGSISRAVPFTDLLALTRAGAAWDFDPAGTLAEVAANQPRVDYDPATLLVRGLLVEQQAVNLFPNPRMQGAVAGTPGTPPSTTGFISGSGSGITRQISVGVQDGIAFTDFRFFGTATAANLVLVGLLANLTCPAVAGETVTGSAFVCIFGPNLPNAGSALRLVEGGASVFSATDVAISQGASAPALRSVRTSVTRTLTDASTTDARLNVVTGNSNGQVLDFTVRVGGTQIVKAAPALSPSFPPVGTPGASARAADDLAATDTSGWFNPAAGTFVMDFTPGQTTSPAHRGLLTVDDGTGANEFRLRMLPGATTVRLSVDVAGVEVFGIQQASGAALTRHTARFSYGPAGWLLSVNGAAPVSGAGPIPAGLVRALVGRGLVAGEYLSGWLGPRFAYYPVQYTDAAAPDGFTIRTR